MKRIFLLIPIILSVLFCSPQKSEDYYPLNDGSEWVYSQQSTLGWKSKFIRRIDGKKTINGKKYFRMVDIYSNKPGEEPEIYYVRKTKKGVYFVYNENKPEVLEYSFPLKIGNSWEREVEAEKVKREVISIETVDLLNRSFEACAKIDVRGILKQTNENFTGYICLAKNVGIVKWVINYDNEQIIEFQLEKYKK